MLNRIAEWDEVWGHSRWFCYILKSRLWHLVVILCQPNYLKPLGKWSVLHLLIPWTTETWLCWCSNTRASLPQLTIHQQVWLQFMIDLVILIDLHIDKSWAFAFWVFVIRAYHRQIFFPSRTQTPTTRHKRDNIKHANHKHNQDTPKLCSNLDLAFSPCPDQPLE